MEVKDLIVVGRLGNVITEKKEYQFIPNDNFQSAIEEVEKLFLIFTEHRVFYVKVNSLSTRKSKYYISFDDDGIEEEFRVRKSCRVAVAENDYHSVVDGETYQDILGYKVYENGELLGEIIDFLYNKFQRVLIVDDGSKEIMIPDVDYYVVNTDHARKTVYTQNSESLREI
ncbi:MAG: hypothetical protein B6226_00545 [Candidatus Cloacimonetes bacterium 4572_65]|nr:MAG: hypothetical protein B6226_00545 [Candidatus Cloacimonetes bacterium 4572_65]